MPAALSTCCDEGSRFPAERWYSLLSVLTGVLFLLPPFAERFRACLSTARNDGSSRAGDHPTVMRRSKLTMNASKRRAEMTERSAKRQASIPPPPIMWSHPPCPPPRPPGQRCLASKMSLYMTQQSTTFR